MKTHLLQFHSTHRLIALRRLLMDDVL